MSTTLLAAQVQLSKDIGDYWASTTTSAGAAGGTTLVDTALMSKNDDWVDDDGAEMYDQITSGTYDTEERRIASLSNTAGTLTVAAHGGQIASAVTYQIHRLWSASEKRIALIQACKDSYPHLYKKIFDESKISGNWLKDGSFEVWTSSSALTYWTKSTSTIAQTSTATLYKHGSYSCKIDTAAGYIKQSISNNTDLQLLAGKNVTFTLQGYCNTASCLRIGIYDGTTYTYSDYHDGDSTWTEDDDPLEVTATIQDNPTVIEFYIYHASASGISYVDDARVICGNYDKIYIGDLGLARDEPSRVSYYLPYSKDEQACRLTKWTVNNGWLYADIPTEYQVRIEGMAYLDFLASGVSSTLWTATVEVDNPQLKILTAYAAMYLYGQKLLPTYTSGESEQSQLALAYWERELGKRINKFCMYPIPVTRKRN